MATTTGSSRRAHREGVMHRLYRGNGAFDIVGKRKRFYIAFAVVLVICVLSMIFRGFNFGIEFTGGMQIQMPAQGVHGTIQVDKARSVYTDTLGSQPDSVQSVGSAGAATIQIRTERLSTADSARVENALFQQLQPIGTNGQPSRSAISDSAVSGSWGGEISRQAIIGLIVFLVLVAIFLSLYFERWMALAALLALANDMVVTAGVYSLVGLEVTPPTVIGLLTILGFSLYDTVVVFDKVKENTKGLLKLTRRSFPEASNLALNQTLMRSINTSLIGLLPVLGLLVVGVGVLGVGTLTDLSLVQLVGLLAGCSSSIFLATPLLVDFKMRQEPYRRQAAKVRARRQSAAKRRAAAQAGVPAGASQVHPAHGQDDPDPGASGRHATPGGDLDEIDEIESDDDVTDDLRHERALAAAASVPARTGKKSEQRPQPRRARPRGKSARSGSKPGGKRGGHR